MVNKKLTIFITVIVLLSITSIIAHAASNDDNVEWYGVGHQKGADLGSNPAYPYFSEDALDPSNKKAVIRLRVYQGDITSANVVYTTNGGASAESDWIYEPMSWEANVSDGGTTYDSWNVTLPSIKSTTVYYKIQINDGTDTDWSVSSGEGSTIVSNSTTWGIASTNISYNAGPTAVSLQSFTTPANTTLPLLLSLLLLLGGSTLFIWRRNHR